MGAQALNKAATSSEAAGMARRRAKDNKDKDVSAQADWHPSAGMV
ncbi:MULTISPECIES: hypothetical protein [Comamonas]|nr:MULTISPECIES: hypothetical protein [Comamonas]